MKKQFSLVVMSFDGEYKIEKSGFDSIEMAWEYSNDLGSKWYFYPFHFVTSHSAKTIKDSPTPLEWANNRRIKTVAKIFNIASKKEETQEMDCEEFAYFV